MNNQVNDINNYIQKINRSFDKLHHFIEDEIFDESAKKISDINSDLESLWNRACQCINREEVQIWIIKKSLDLLCFINTVPATSYNNKENLFNKIRKRIDSHFLYYFNKEQLIYNMKLHQFLQREKFPIREFPPNVINAHAQKGYAHGIPPLDKKDEEKYDDNQLNEFGSQNYQRIMKYIFEHSRSNYYDYETVNFGSNDFIRLNLISSFDLNMYYLYKEMEQIRLEDEKIIDS